MALSFSPETDDHPRPVVNNVADMHPRDGAIVYDGRTVDPAFKFFYVLVGAVAAAYYTRSNPSGVKLIKRLFPQWSTENHERGALIVGLIISVAGAYALYDTKDAEKAMVAGCSSVALVRQIAQGR